MQVYLACIDYKSTYKLYCMLISYKPLLNKTSRIGFFYTHVHNLLKQVIYFFCNAATFIPLINHRKKDFTTYQSWPIMIISILQSVDLRRLWLTFKMASQYNNYSHCNIWLLYTALQHTWMVETYTAPIKSEKHAFAKYDLDLWHMKMCHWHRCVKASPSSPY